ncbi:MAG TPA: histidine kinase [Gammaproteobacteria bacterium]
MPSAIPAPTDRRARFLPDFCSAPAIAEILVIAELVAMVLTLSRGLNPGADVLRDFIAISLFMLWLAFAAAAVLCAAGRRLAHLSAARAYLACYGLLLATTAIISGIGAWADRELQFGMLAADPAGVDMLMFVARNLIISAIVSAVALRYFHVQYQWRRQVRREAGARIEALQARIRPHFLFNSLNTIAALIPVAPNAAEQAVEDLSDLFRASLDDAAVLVPLDEEIALARLYQRLEEKRLGERLDVDWQIALPEIPVRLPRLTLQPLLENAIHHGIERLREGGTVRISGETTNDGYRLTVTNPVADGTTESRGFHIALENTRERLALALGKRALLATRRNAGYFEAEVILPQDADHARTDR